MMFRLATIIALAAASAGCSYLEARGRDLGDCFRFSVGAGLGVHTDLHVCIVGTGAGYWTGWEAGWYPKSEPGQIGRTRRGKFDTALAENFWVPLPLVLAPVALALSQAWGGRGIGPPPFMFFGAAALLGGGLCYSAFSEHVFRGRNDVFINGKYGFFVVAYREHLHDWTDAFWVEASAYFFVGFRLGFNLAEFADFLLGWFGLDLCDDDGRCGRIGSEQKQEN